MAREKLDLFSWALKGNPFSLSKDDYFVAEENGDICGYQGSIPYKLSINGKDLEVQIHFDSLVDPSKRGKGIYSSILGEIDKYRVPLKILMMKRGYRL